MVSDDLTAIAESAVKRGLTLGADEIEAYMVTSESANVELENNDIHLGCTDVRSGTGIRVFRRRGMGYASTNSLEENEIVKAIEKAVQLASCAPEEPWNKLPDKKVVHHLPGLYDPESETFSTEEALDLAREMLTATKDVDSRISIESGVFSAERSHEAIANSRGVCVEERTSIFLYYLTGMAREGEEVSNMDYSLRFTHNMAKINVDEVVEEFAKRILSSLGARSVESFQGPVILGPDACRLLLGSVLSHALNSDNAQKGTSRYAGKLNQAVADPLLDVEDNALLEDGFGSSSFDREGIPHRKLGLIEGGVLKSFLYNTKTALKEDRESTGNAAGDERSPPSVGTTNIIIGAGTTPLSEMVSEMDHGLIIRRVSGFPDPLSGDFSAVIKGGFLVKGGEIISPVTDTMITGNIFTLLKNMLMISKERENVLNFTTPYIMVSGATITGK